jgi:hypothetical protein
MERFNPSEDLLDNQVRIVFVEHRLLDAVVIGRRPRQHSMITSTSLSSLKNLEKNLWMLKR